MRCEEETSILEADLCCCQNKLRQMVARHEDDERKIGTELQAAKQNAEELSAALQAELSDMNAQQRREQVRFPL